MAHDRTWIVGTDLTARSRGALRFAHWLYARSGDVDSMRCVYVVTGARGEPRVEEARDHARAAAEALHVSDAFEAFDTLSADSPDDGLARAADEACADGLIVGRSGRIEGWSLISLGRVTRRLLRRAAKPVVVVAPDHDPQTLGRGPIVVGVVPTDANVAAVRFARELAISVDLPLLLVHVTADFARHPAAGVDPALAYGYERSRPDEADGPSGRALDDWIAANHLAAIEHRCEPGLPGQKLLQIAREEQASLIVCGSRHLSVVERIINTSTGSELAANSDRPVIVVPPAA